MRRVFLDDQILDFCQLEKEVGVLITRMQSLSLHNDGLNLNITRSGTDIQFRKIVTCANVEVVDDSLEVMLKFLLDWCSSCDFQARIPDTLREMPIVRTN